MRVECLALVAIVSLFFAADLRAAAPATRPAAQPSKLAAESAESLKANAATFSMRLDYNGESDKPYYRLDLSVPEMDFKTERNAFHQHVQITEAEAKKIIDQLAAGGFFDTATSGQRKRTPLPPAGPYYAITIEAQKNGERIQWEEWIPFSPALFERLDGLRSALDGDAAKSMDTLLGRLSGERNAMDKPATK